MKLGDANPGDVVRNSSNGSHYRYERPEEGRVRIRPLEAFPNGLLIEKPVDTIVEPTLDVLVIGPWHEDMMIMGGGGKSRRTYEAELERLELQLASLETEAETLGPKERGSHANKVKAARNRILVLKRGLAQRDEEGQLVEEETAASTMTWALKDMVLLPSGKPGMVVGFVPQEKGANPLASVLIRKPSRSIDCLPVDQSVLQPLASRHLATV